MKPILFLALLTLLLGCSKIPDNTIEISTEKQLREFARQVNSGDDFSDKTIILKKNIALKEDWVPIGDSINRFKGIFNGNGKTISGLSVSNARYAGLFGYVGENGQIKNTHVVATKIEGNFAGGLAGAADLLTISNSYVSGNISGGEFAGGLVGTGSGMLVSNSCVSGNVSTYNENSAISGGLVGDVRDSIIISNSCSIGNVSASSYSSKEGMGFDHSTAGGLIGFVTYKFTISNSFSIGNVFANTHYKSVSGGLVGVGIGNIYNSYAIGNLLILSNFIYGNYSGGLIGISYSDSNSDYFTISNSYAKGNISILESNKTYRHLYKDDFFIMFDMYFMFDFYSGNIFSHIYDYSNETIDFDSTKRIDGIKNTSYLQGNSRETPLRHRGSLTKILSWASEDLKKQESYKDWNFDSVWNINSNINDGYPYLRSSEKFIKELEKEHSELGGIHGADSSNSRSKEEIMHFVNLYMPVLNNIYNAYLNLKPGFSGEVVLKFTIAPQGIIRDFKDISILSSTTGFPEFDEAIKNMVSSWQWENIDGGSYTITVPLRFGETL